MRDRAKRGRAQRRQSTSSLLSLPTNTLIFGLISAPELVRLRTSCKQARELVDSLTIWNEIVQAMNKNNTFNLTCEHHDRSGQPFVLQATGGGGKNLEEGQEDGYDKKQDKEYREWMQDFTGPENAFASKDPRIQASFASLRPFDQCSKLYLFTRAAVERIQNHLPLLMEEGEESTLLRNPFPIPLAQFFDPLGCMMQKRRLGGEYLLRPNTIPRNSTAKSTACGGCTAIRAPSRPCDTRPVSGSRSSTLQCRI